jgi:segregation and condensation protein B
MDNTTVLDSALEGILFASGDPVSAERLAAVLGTDLNSVAASAERLRAYYETNKRGIRLVKVAGAYQLCSSPELADDIRLALETGRAPRLTQTALEVLAVVAYFQPVTKSYIEQVRGVDCTYTIGMLQTRGLIERRGHLSIPGRPSLYGTTSDFLRTFGLASLEDLPQLAIAESAPAEADAPESAPVEADVSESEQIPEQTTNDAEGET